MGNACERKNEAIADDYESRVDGSTEEQTPVGYDAVVLRSESTLEKYISAIAANRDSNGSANLRDFPRLRLGQEHGEVNAKVDVTPTKLHRQELLRLEERRADLRRQHEAVERELSDLLAARAELDEKACLQRERNALEHDMVELQAAKAPLESVRQGLLHGPAGEPPAPVPENWQDNSAGQPLQTAQGTPSGHAERPVPQEPAQHEALQSKALRALSPLATMLEDPESKQREATAPYATGPPEPLAEGVLTTPAQALLGVTPAPEAHDFSARRGRKQFCVPQDEQPPLFTKRGMEVVFFDLDGNERTKYIGKRPLGAKFARHSHSTLHVSIKISYVATGSQASNLGLQVGWLVKEVIGQDLRHRSFEDAQQLLIDGMASLPEA